MLSFFGLVFVVLGAVRGCSVPVGGFVEPTEAKIVYSAEYVVIGKVTKLITPDPVLPYDSTYAAHVQIACQYKGEVISKEITIVGAGLIPGHCTAQDLKQNTDYILFLSKKGEDYFEQTSTARNVTDIKRFLHVCDLMLKTLVDFPSVRCQAATKSPDCERYNPPVDKPVPVAPPSPPPKPITHPPEHVENVQMADKGAAQKGQITTTPSGAQTNRLMSFLLVFAIVLQVLVFL